MNVCVFAHPTGFLPSSGHSKPNNRKNPWRRCGAMLLALLLAFSFADGALAANKKTRNTLIGVGVGAAAGALLSHGDTWGTLGGAAAGGLIGNVVTKDRHHRDRDRRRNQRYYDDRRGDWNHRRR